MSLFKRLFKKKLLEKRVEKESEKEAVKETKEKVVEKPEIKKEQKPEEKPKKIEDEKKAEQKPPVLEEKKPVQKLSKKAARIAPHVLIRPIFTEKATFGEAQGVYTFEVAPGTNKISVKKAVQELYNVEPVKVNIIRRKGKQVRYGRSVGRTKDRKRAIVFLRRGDKIEFVARK